MHILWINSVKHHNAWLFIWDVASYMKKSGGFIKALYSKRIHVIYLAHTLHTVYKELNTLHYDTDK